MHYLLDLIVDRDQSSGGVASLKNPGVQQTDEAIPWYPLHREVHASSCHRINSGTSASFFIKACFSCAAYVAGSSLFGAV